MAVMLWQRFEYYYYIYMSVVLPCLPCLVMYNKLHVNIQLGVGCHWWFNYVDLLLSVEFKLACLLLSYV